MKRTSERPRPAVLILAIALTGAFTAPAFGAPVRLSLDEAIARGMSQNKEIKAESARVGQAEADIDRVYGEFGPRLEGIAGLGPITRTTGDALRSQEEKNNWGAIFLGQLELTQPLYAWGRKSDYLAAAKNGKLVNQEDVRLKRDDVRYQIKEAYFGSLYTLSLLEFIRDGKKDIERVEQELARKIGKEERFKLEILHAQIAAKEAEVEKAHELARTGLALRIGAGAGEEVLPKEEWIEESERAILPLEHYVGLSRREKPEFRKLQAGIAAKRSLASAERKGQFPVLAFIAKYDFAHTKMRVDQQSVFAYDPYNQDNLVVGLGLKWDFQWGLQTSKAAKFAAEAEELEAKQSFANDGIAVLVKKAWLELKEADAKLKAARDGSKAAKKWLANAMIGVSSGLGDVQKIVDAYQARALTLKDFYEAIFRHHLAWAQLSLAVGAEVDPLVVGSAVGPTAVNEAAPVPEPTATPAPAPKKPAPKKKPSGKPGSGTPAGDADGWDH